MLGLVLSIQSWPHLKIGLEMSTRNLPHCNVMWILSVKPNVISSSYIIFIYIDTPTIHYCIPRQASYIY